MSAPQQERSRLRREALVRAAVEIIAESGAGAVTHRAVAARAGLPASTTGYFFASINDLAEEALRIHVRTTVDDFLALVREPTDPETLFAAIGAFTVDPVIELSELSLALEASRNSAMRAPVAEAMKAYEEVTEKILHAIGLSRAAEASPAFVALFQGFMLRHLALPDHPPRPELLVEALRALFRGYSQ